MSLYCNITLLIPLKMRERKRGGREDAKKERERVFFKTQKKKQKEKK